MRARFLLCILVVSILALPAAADASHDPSGAPFDEDFATGELVTTVCVPFGPPAQRCLVLGIDAHSGPSGENPTGTVSFVGTNRVTCLNVNGTRATIGIETVISTVTFEVLVFVTDNAASGQPDEIYWDSGGNEPGVCPSTLTPGAERVTGDFVVHDAQPFPTTKEQCKNGGWQSYGVFKNQGDCVNFVATGGKNPPANTP
jgi:hypothetical protein